MTSTKIDVQTNDFGVTSDTKEPVKIYTLSNSLPVQVELIEYGASLRSLRVPLKDGRLVDVVLGFEKLDGYEKNNAYFGVIAGRVCNRIKAGTFAVDGQTYHLPINNGPNHLHGGIKGFSRRVWKTKEIGSDFVTFEYLSPDGEEGYPSAVRATITYRLSPNSSRLTIEFNAINEGKKTTPINLTNHSYFNLRGVDQDDANIKDHLLAVFSDKYMPTDDDAMVTGEILPVDGTIFDLRSPARLGDRFDRLLPKLGYDHSFCYNVTSTPKSLAKLSLPETGLSLSIFGTQPGLQVYTGQYTNETGGKYGRSYGKHSGIALETQHFPDSVNHPNFPPIFVRPGEKYHQVTIYDFSQE